MVVDIPNLDAAVKKWLLALLFIIGLFWALSNFQGLAAQGTYESIILDFREDIGAAQMQQQVEFITQQFKRSPHLNSAFSLNDRIFIVQGDQEFLQQLRRSPVRKYTEYIEPDYIYSALLTPNDPDYDKQWNLRSINMEAAWDETKGKGITVAVIDTGVTPVPDLQEVTLVKGYDFVNDREEAKDDNGHGTHVAGTIAQATNNGVGVAGIAYEAAIMPLKVLSSGGGGTVADIAEAIRFAADQGADVINMSLGGGGESHLMQESIDYAHRKGVVIVAAAGNANQNAVAYPARYTHVIGVAATDASGVKAPYSNYGAGVDLAAPGGAIVGDNKTGGILQNTINPETGESVYEYLQGTSMAAPHVAGVAALVKAAGVKEPDQIEAVLKQSVIPVQDDQQNHYGAGKLNADAAVKLALKGKITFKDFFLWLRDNGYLNPRFWIDGGVVALWPKLMMVVGSYLLAWMLKNFFPFPWTLPLSLGLVAGSSGLFFLKGMYLFDAPQWPFRVMGSSIPELGSAIHGGGLHPLTASLLIPVVLILLLLGHSQWKWFAIGTTIGVGVCLAVSAVLLPSVLWLGSGAIARLFLAVNAALCLLLARFVIRTEARST